MSDAWFKPKRYGYGAEPLGWKGWAAIAGFIGILAVSSILILGEEPSPGAWGLWLAVTAASTLAFVLFCRARTDGEWRWRWGERDGTPESLG